MTQLRYDPSGYGYRVHIDGSTPVYFERARDAYDYHSAKCDERTRDFYRERRRLREWRRQPDGGLLTNHLLMERDHA